MAVYVRAIEPDEFEAVVPELVELFREAVDGGASLGFLPPLSAEEARTYWLSLRPELERGGRVLIAAFAENRLAGSGQLMLPPWPNGRHRVEIQKLFVARAFRGCGIGRSLIVGLHNEARRRGRSLIVLYTRRGDPAERFYRGLGYVEAGVFPGYTVGPAGERYDNVAMYQVLPP
jgi:ribosomal protein S18 acetylase RimI-like enzyme